MRHVGGAHDIPVELDLSAAGRALEYLGLVSNSLITLHADFVLAFIVGVVALRRRGAGRWGDAAYASFLLGLTAVLLIGIVFLGLRLSIAGWLVFLAGLAAACLAWTMSGAVPLRRGLRVVRSLVSGIAFRARRPRVPDRLPRELRSLGSFRR